MAATKAEIQVRCNMESLGVYKSEFDQIIKIYCQLRRQYDTLTRDFVKSKFEYSELTKTGTKKAPIVTTLETLRKDILTYASQLGLTPQGLLRADDKAFAKSKLSVLSKALQEFDEE